MNNHIKILVVKELVKTKILNNQNFIYRINAIKKPKKVEKYLIRLIRYGLEKLGMNFAMEDYESSSFIRNLKNIGCHRQIVPGFYIGRFDSFQDAVNACVSIRKSKYCFAIPERGKQVCFDYSFFYSKIRRCAFCNPDILYCRFCSSGLSCDIEIV